MTPTPRNAADVVGHLEELIASGTLRPGDRLEPVRALALNLGLAPNTVAVAYRTLRERGYTIGLGRAGTFVADRPALGGLAEDAVPDGLVDLSNGHPDPALLPSIADAMRAVSYAPATYSTAGVDTDLAALFRGELAADGIDATNLAVVGGALDGIERVLALRLRPGDSVAVEDPGYSSVLDLVAAMGLRIIPMAVDEAGPAPDALVAAIDAGASAVIITPRAQNPTGAAVGPERSEALRRILAASPTTLVIEDDHSGPVAGAAHHPVVTGERPCWAVVRSVSKSLGPDLRLAALVGDATTIGRVAGRQAVGTGWVSHLLQRLVVELRSDGAAALTLAADSYAARRGALVAALSERGIVAASASGLNVWVPVPDEAAVVGGLARRGFAVRAGARFRQKAPPGVRVTVASSDEASLVDVAVAFAEVLTPAAPRRIA